MDIPSHSTSCLPQGGLHYKLINHKVKQTTGCHHKLRDVISNVNVVSNQSSITPVKMEAKYDENEFVKSLCRCFINHQSRMTHVKSFDRHKLCY